MIDNKWVHLSQVVAASRLLRPPETFCRKKFKLFCTQARCNRLTVCLSTLGGLLGKSGVVAERFSQSTKYLWYFCDHSARQLMGIHILCYLCVYTDSPPWMKTVYSLLPSSKTVKTKNLSVKAGRCQMKTLQLEIHTKDCQKLKINLYQWTKKPFSWSWCEFRILFTIKKLFIHFSTDRRRVWPLTWRPHQLSRQIHEQSSPSGCTWREHRDHPPLHCHWGKSWPATGTGSLYVGIALTLLSIKYMIWLSKRQCCLPFGMNSHKCINTWEMQIPNVTLRFLSGFSQICIVFSFRSHLPKPVKHFPGKGFQSLYC